MCVSQLVACNIEYLQFPSLGTDNNSCFQSEKRVFSFNVDTLETRGSIDHHSNANGEDNERVNNQPTPSSPTFFSVSTALSRNPPPQTPVSPTTSAPPVSHPHVLPGAGSLSCPQPPKQSRHIPSEVELKFKRLHQLICKLPEQLAEAGKYDYNLAAVDPSVPDEDGREPGEVYHDVLQRMFGMRAAAAKSTKESRQAAFRLSKAGPDNGSLSSPGLTPIAQATQHDGSVLWGRGPHAERIVDGFKKALKTCPGDGVILKWLDDVTSMTEEAYEYFGTPVSTLALYGPYTMISCPCSSQIMLSNSHI